jgi:hypothetical protein
VPAIVSDLPSRSMLNVFLLVGFQKLQAQKIIDNNKRQHQLGDTAERALINDEYIHEKFSPYRELLG